MLASSRITRITFCFTAKTKTADAPTSSGTSAVFFMTKQRQHRTIPALRLKHRSGSCGTASALPKCSIMSGCGTRIVPGAKAPRTLRAAPASVRCFRHWRRSPCSIQYYLRFWLGICRTSLAVSALRIMRYCPKNYLSNCIKPTLRYTLLTVRLARRAARSAPDFSTLST